MKVGSKEIQLISFINTMLSDKDDIFILCNPEWGGTINLDVGNNKKKKYQYIKGELTIPHNILKDEFKTNYSVIDKTRFYQYAYIPKRFINEETHAHIEATKEEVVSYFEKYPKVKKAFNNLIDALKEVKNSK